MDSARRHAWHTLRFRDFRLLWAGQAVSVAGTQMQRVAVAWQVYDLTGSPVALGLLGACRLVPTLVLSLVGGAVADRYDRRWVMLASTLVMAAASAVLSLATATDSMSLGLLYAMVVLAAGANAFAGPARQALVPSLVAKESLQQALTLSMLTWDVAGIVGPALGGVLLGRYGAALIYLLDAGSYLAVAAALLLMKAGPVRPTAPATSGVHAVAEGIRFVLGHRVIVSTMLLDFVATFFGQATVLYPVFAKEVLHCGTAGLGLMYSLPAAGSVLTGLLMASLPSLTRQGQAVVVSVAFYGMATVVFGLSTWLPLTLLALAAAGAADTVSTVLRQTMRQRLTPDELRGRMTSVNMIFFMGGPQLGELESGLAAAWLGPGLAVVAGGVGVLLTVAFTAARVPSLVRYRDPAAPPG